MKRKRPNRTGQAPPVIAVAVTVLAVLTAATAPLSMLSTAKYSATATVSASARVAKFEPRFAQVTGYWGQAGYAVKNTAAGYPTTVLFPKYFIRNKSEVAVNLNIAPYYVPTPYGTPAEPNGKYYNSGAARSLMVSTGTGGKLLHDLRYDLTDGTRANASPTGTALPANGVLLEAWGGTNTSVLFAPYFRPQVNAATKPANVIGTDTTGAFTSPSYDMSELWRTYKINYDLIVTQID